MLQSSMFSYNYITSTAWNEFIKDKCISEYHISENLWCDKSTSMTCKIKDYIEQDKNTILWMEELIADKISHDTNLI